ncbi:MAG: sugar phosphate isomerase/epimerase family protein [Bacteroidota bacterium]
MAIELRPVITIWTDMLRELPIEEALRLCAEAGFGGVEFGVSHDRALVEAGGDVLARAARIGERARALGVAVVQMHAPMVNLCNPEETGAIDALQASVERAAALGARWLVVHPGHDPAASWSRRVDVAVRQANLQAFERLLDVAQRYDIGLAVENMTTYASKPGYPKMDIRFGQSVADLLWLVETLGSQRLGICWDTGHAHTQRIDQAAAVREMGPHLKALHLSDNDGTADSHWLPLRGSVAWGPFFQALRQVDYRGALNFEVPGELRVPLPLRRHILRLVRELADYLWCGESWLRQVEPAAVLAPSSTTN